MHILLKRQPFNLSGLTFLITAEWIVDEVVVEALVLLLLPQCPNAYHMTIKIRTVLKQPPPNFLAPYPAIKALKKIFIYKFILGKITKNYSLKNYY